MVGTERLVEEHKRLSNEWLEAERFRVEVLENLIKEHGGKCTMDYPENIFKSYDVALSKASLASKEYVRWLAQQGFPSR
tara:strand:- start:466 stop:702 length:237 start_codon:yes stop_codon:yes gene_type:complete